MSTDVVKDGEVVEESGPSAVQSLVKAQDLPLLKLMEQAKGLDWKQLTPPQLALLIMQKPLPVSGGGATFLTFKQALIYAYRCFELGLSPFSGQTFFDPAKSTVAITLEGKRELARLKGIDLGPPNFERMERSWNEVPRMTGAGEEARKAGFLKDIGYRCRVRVGPKANDEHSEYLAWISEWFQPRSPVWKEKPEHMLMTRAMEKAITLSLGTGASSMPDERDLE